MPWSRARTWCPTPSDRLLKDGKLIAQRHIGFWRAADTFKDRVELEEMFRHRAMPVDAVGHRA